MHKRARLLLLIILAASSGHGQSYLPALQTQLDSIDKISDDSLALIGFESVLAKNKSSLANTLFINLYCINRTSRLGQFEKSLLLGNEGLKRARENKLDSIEAAYYKKLGNTYYFMDRRDEAAEYYKKAIDLANSKNYWQIEADCCNNLGGLLIDQKKTEAAEPFMLRAIRLMENNGKGDDQRTLKSYRILATLYANTNRFKQGETIFLKLLEKSKKQKNWQFYATNLIFYARLLDEKKEYTKALTLSTEGLAYSRKLPYVKDLLAAIRFHSLILSHLGRYKEALDLQGEAYTLQAKNYEKEFTKQIGELEVKYKTAQLQLEKEQALEKASKQKQFYFFLFFATLICSGVILYILNQKRNARLKAAAHQARLQALIEGEEKERGRVARDLHDGIVQELTAIKLKLGTAVKNETQLNDAIIDLDKATREVRDIAYQMMPVALREFGLLIALEQLLQKALTPLNIQYDFETVNINARLPEKIEVCLYRITQELVNNVIKHSKASSVSLVVSRFKEAITLVMEDNGTGFKEDIQKGIGMNSVASRLEMVNGDLKFESGEGAGTIAIIKIPFTGN